MGSSWADLGPSVAFYGHLRAILGRLGAILEPSWALLGPSCSRLGPSWAVLGPSWGHLGPFWGHLGAILGLLGLSWGRLGPSWAVLGPSWAILIPSTGGNRKNMKKGISFEPQNKLKMSSKSDQFWGRFWDPFQEHFGGVRGPLWESILGQDFPREDQKRPEGPSGAVRRDKRGSLKSAIFLRKNHSS